MEDKQSTVFETADLGLAAYLLTQGCPLLVAEREKTKFSFVFEGQEKCKLLALKYVNSEFAKFDSALKNLKNLVK